MANFHDNLAVIAAHEDGMYNVLLRFAANLAAHADETGFDISGLRKVRSVRGLHQKVSPYVENCWWLSFSGAPAHAAEATDEGGAADGQGVSALTLERQRKLISMLASGTQTPEESSDADDPFARPLSETADVTLNLRGDVYVLSISYSTAWGSDYISFDALLSGLPRGDYGVAFFDADEYDGFDQVSTLYGLHHGCHGFHHPEPEDSKGTICAENLGKEAQDILNSADAADDLARIARTEAVLSWAKGHYDLVIPKTPRPRAVDRKPAAASPECDSSEQLLQGAFKIEHADVFIRATLEGFPWLVGITGTAYLGREENVERLALGELLELRSDWNSPYFSPTCIEAFTVDGRSIGNVDRAGWELPPWLRPVLACMLPHVTAYVEEVTPLSAMHFMARYPHIVLRLEINDEPLTDIFDNVKTVFRLQSEASRPQPDSDSERNALASSGGAQDGKSSKARPAKRITRKHVKAAVDELAELMRDVPDNEKPPTFDFLCDEYPQFAPVLKYGLARWIVDSDDLKERGIIHYSIEGLEARGVDVTRRGRKYTPVSELAQRYLEAGGEALLMPDEASGFLRPGIIGMDVVAGYELREATLVAVDAAQVEPGAKLRASYTVRKRGNCPLKIKLSMRSGRKSLQVAMLKRFPANDFVAPKVKNADTVLNGYVSDVVQTVEQAGGVTIARVRHRFMHPLTQETLLFALRRMGGDGLAGDGGSETAA